MYRRGFTVLELVTVIVITAILVTMLLPAVAGMRARAERGACINNLRGLYSAVSSYVMDKQEWPQIPTRQVQSPAFALAWINALAPYGIARKNWVCPGIQRQLQGPDIDKDANARVDYVATQFDSNPRSPFKWQTHPWFIERGDMHGEGNLIIFANGQVKSLMEVRRDSATQRMD